MQTKILVVDDEPDVRNYLSSFLEDEGFTIRTAENGRAAITAIEEEKPEWPIREIARVLHSLDRARFAPAVPSDIVELAERSDAIALSLRRSALEDGER